jgi:low temperature requirement protein LtrA
MTDDLTVRGGTDRPASTIELFFDLVYVYAITQVVGLLHDGSDTTALAQGALILWLLWWTWGIYTWTTNWTGTDDTPTRMFLLATMGATLLMSLTIPDAFGGGAQWFGVLYFAVRMMAGALYWHASGEHPRQRAAFMTFFPAATFAAALILIGGFLDPPWLTVMWVAGGIVDLIAAASAGRGTWAVDPHHFAERNGLFIIVALGETIVGIGLSAAGVERDAIHIAAVVVGFVIASSLWWAYFHRAAPLLEDALASATGQARGRIARDAYSLLHYPLVVGIVFYAVAAEEIIAHPTDPLDQFGRLALSLGVSLALLAIAASVFRVTHRIPTIRIATALVIMGIGAIAGTWNAVAFAVSIAIVVACSLVLTQLRPWVYGMRGDHTVAETIDD